MARTIEIQAQRNGETFAVTVKATGIKGTPFAIHQTHEWEEGQECRWTVTHVATGVALVCPRREMSRPALRALVLKWWEGCTEGTRKHLSECETMAVMRERSSEVDPHDVARLRAAGRGEPEPARQPIPGVAWKGVARNVYTDETREIVITEAEARAVMLEDDHATCSGPCECNPLEPDGTCSKGWPSRLRAAGII